MARVGFKPRPCWSRAQRFNHSTTLPIYGQTYGQAPELHRWSKRVFQLIGWMFQTIGKWSIGTRSRRSMKMRKASVANFLKFVKVFETLLLPQILIFEIL